MTRRAFLACLSPLAIERKAREPLIRFDLRHRPRRLPVDWPTRHKIYRIFDELKKQERVEPSNVDFSNHATQ